MRQYMLLGTACVWAANCWWLGILAERHQQAQEGEDEAKGEPPEPLTLSRSLTLYPDPGPRLPP